MLIVLRAAQSATNVTSSMTVAIRFNISQSSNQSALDGWD
jgi:hypothetical protein